MEALGRVVRDAVRSPQLTKRRCSLMDWVLGIRQATPMATIYEEHSHWKR
jgi:hypothetical protein